MILRLPPARSVPPARFLLALLVACSSVPLQAADRTFSFGRFSRVALSGGPEQPRHLVILLSDEGGTRLAGRDLNESIAGSGGLVAGVNARAYLEKLRGSKEPCIAPSFDLVDLARMIEKKEGFPTEEPPVLVGQGTGAALVYAVAAQAAPQSFKGALSLGFCPTDAVPQHYCRGTGLESEPADDGWRLLPQKHLSTPWIVLVQKTGGGCDPAAVESFVKDIFGADILLWQPTGDKNEPGWRPSLRVGLERLLTARDVTPPSEEESVRGLPLIEIGARGPERDAFAVLISGDGGWAAIDRQLAKTFTESGVPVVGLNSLKYFWKRRTPEEASADLARIMRHYASAWHKSRIVLVGYSRGADTMGFMANRLPGDLLDKTALIALLGLEHTVRLEIGTSDIFNMKRKDEMPIRPELEKLAGRKMVCFYGDEEKDSLCRELPPSLIEAVELKGGHHFGGDYDGIARQILDRVKEPPASPRPSPSRP